MNDPRRPPRYVPPPSGSGPTGSQGPRYSPPIDPAYADQAAAYGPTYGSYVPTWTPTGSEQNQTRQLPPYWQQDYAGQDEFAGGGSTPPPEPPTTPRWLWVVASAAVLLVVALVIALVVANDSAKEQTAVEPLPPVTAPSSTYAPPPTITRTPSRTPRTTTRSPDTTTAVPVPGAMQTVVYSVTGEGRAISVSYLDTGELIQTEFNVALPWHKEVSLPQSSERIPSVTIINIGHNVTCSVSVAGVQVRQRTGVGLTICDAPT